jgi:hypothetical protein
MLVLVVLGDVLTAFEVSIHGIEASIVGFGGSGGCFTSN